MCLVLITITRGGTAAAAVTDGGSEGNEMRWDGTDDRTGQDTAFIITALLTS